MSSFVCWLVRTSNAVSIDIVLGDKPIVVTPSSVEARHGIVLQPLGFGCLEFPR